MSLRQTSQTPITSDWPSSYAVGFPTSIRIGSSHFELAELNSQQLVIERNFLVAPCAPETGKVTMCTFSLLLKVLPEGANDCAEGYLADSKAEHTEAH